MKPLCLALSGGGAHAAAHCGVLRALERERIPVAGMTAVSGAALVAALWAAGVDMDRFVAGASELHPWMWVRGWGGGLLSGSRLGALIDEWLPPVSFAELRVPLVVIATDVDAGEPVVLASGSVRDAVRASCSFPASSRRTRSRGAGSSTAACPRWSRCAARERWPATRASSWPSTATRAAAGRRPTRSSRSRCAPG